MPDQEQADEAIPSDASHVEQQPVQNVGSGSSEPATQDPDRFAKWTEKARQALAFSEEEAVRLGDGFIGDEHLLLGLMQLDSGIVYDIFAANKLNLDRTREAIRVRHNRVLIAITTPHRALRLTAKEAVEGAVQEARERRQHYVASWDILLSLTRQRPGVLSYHILRELGASPRAIRRRAIKAIAAVSATSSTSKHEPTLPSKRHSFLARLHASIFRRTPK